MSTYEAMTGLSTEAIQKLQTEEHALIKDMNIDALSAHIAVMEAASRELHVKIQTSRKSLHTKLANLTDEEVAKLNLKVPSFLRPAKGTKAAKEKEKSAKKQSSALKLLESLGIKSSEGLALIADLKKGKASTPGR